MINFAMVGFGYIAKRHIETIKNVGGTLIAVYDPHNVGGILDSYFPNCKFFTEFVDFDLYCQKNIINYLTIACPNYLHKSYIQWGVNRNYTVICEKPLIINTQDFQESWKGKVYPIVQLRLHPKIKEFMKQIVYEQASIIPYNVEIDYQTPRGNWYYQSWKNEISKSGGLLFNIGVHFFDLINYMFGDIKDIVWCKIEEGYASGGYNTAYAHVQWNLKIDCDKPVRIIKVNGVGLDLSESFTNLHTECYKEILAGRGFSCDTCLPAVSLINQMKLL